MTERKNELAGLVGLYLPRHHIDRIGYNQKEFEPTIKAIVNELGDTVVSVTDNGSTCFYADTEDGFRVFGNGYVSVSR